MRSNPYLDEIIDFGGEWMPRGRVIATMQREGHDQRCIDRWLQGQELGAELRRRRAEEELSANESATQCE